MGATCVLTLALAACSGSEPDAAMDTTPGSEATVDAAPAPETAVAATPSFDCGASDLGEVERRICADPGLAALDVRLDSVWREVEALAESREVWDFDTVRAEQRGWIGGRDECWKAPGVAAREGLGEDEAIRRCISEAYRSRTARLQARWRLVEPSAGPTFWACEGNPANEFVTTFFETDPSAADVERGDQAEIFLRTPTASGSRYEGTFGKWFWMRGDSATVVWPQSDTLSCVVRTAR